MAPEDLNDTEDISSLLKKTAEEAKQEEPEEKSEEDISDIFTDFDFSEVSEEDDDFLEGVIPFDEALLVKDQKQVLPPWIFYTFFSITTVVLVGLAYFYTVKPFLYSMYFKKAVASLANQTSPEDAFASCIKFAPDEFESYIDFGYTCCNYNNLKLARKYLYLAKYQDTTRKPMSSLYDINRLTDLTKSEKVSLLNLETRIFIEENQLMDARKLCEKVQQLVGDMDETHYNLGIIALKKDNYDLAIRHFKKVISLNIDYVSAYLQLRRLYLKLDLPEEAYKIHRLLEGLDTKVPHDFEYFAAIGQIFFSRGDLITAKKNFERSLDLNPDQSLPYLKLAEIYITRKQKDKSADYKRAIEYYLKYLDINPLDALIKAEVGKLYYMRNDIKNAVLYLQKSIEMNPNVGQARYYIGNIQLDYFKNFRLAIHAFEKALALDFSTPHLLLNLAKSYYYNGTYDKTISMLSQMLDKKEIPKESTRYFITYNLGNACLMNGNYQQAITLYARLLSQDPDLTPQFKIAIYNNLAVAHEITGNLKESLTAVWEAVDLQDKLNDKNTFIQGSMKPGSNLKRILANEQYKSLKDVMEWEFQPVK